MGKYLKIGDIFEVDLENKMKGYVQYIVDDWYQLNSRVIRVFKKKYPFDEHPEIDEIVRGEIDFYTHVADIKVGEKEGIWKKIGKSEDVGECNFYFRGTYDSGMITLDSPNHVSKDWYLWRVGEDPKDVKPNSKLLALSHQGMIIWPDSIKERMITDKYHGFFPKYPGEL